MPAKTGTVPASPSATKAAALGPPRLRRARPGWGQAVTPHRSEGHRAPRRFARSDSLRTQVSSRLGTPAREEDVGARTARAGTWPFRVPRRRSSPAACLGLLAAPMAPPALLGPRSAVGGQGSAPSRWAGPTGSGQPPGRESRSAAPSRGCVRRTFVVLSLHIHASLISFLLRCFEGRELCETSYFRESLFLHKFLRDRGALFVCSFVTAFNRPCSGPRAPAPASGVRLLTGRRS